VTSEAGSKPEALISGAGSKPEALILHLFLLSCNYSGEKFIIFYVAMQ
jgi:hypothetical protein